MSEKELDQRIIAWNEERNGLKYKFSLERRMLQEEIVEFYQATTLENQLKELLDVCFVMVGTLAKIKKNNVTSAASELLVESMESAMTGMAGILMLDGRIRQMTPHDYNQFLTECFEAVISANEAKGKDMVNGKVIKGENYVAPEPVIKELLLKYTGKKTEGGL